MLKQRLITAFTLAVVLYAVLTIGAPWAFAWFALLTVGLVIEEWLVLLGWSRSTAIASALATAAVLWLASRTPFADGLALSLWSVACLVWVILAARLFTRGQFWDVRPRSIGPTLLATALPAACWLGLVDVYAAGGFTRLVSLLAIVWAADVAAYFAGRAFGKRKLAPAISPGKTWAGAIGGAIAAMVVALVSMAVPSLSNSFFAVLSTRVPPVLVLASAGILAALSIVGDLFESHLKRQHGVKDSGRLLPGHGGVFDRVDAMLPIVPVALLLQRFG